MTQAIFITGAASGMGRATALLFAARGWFVGAFDVDEAGLDSLRGELDAGRSLVQRLDVTDRDAFRAALAAFGEAGGGRLDILFNNAGISRRGHFDTQPFEHYAAMVQVNIMGVLNGVYEAVPLLKATPNSLCFTTSSSSTTFGMPGIAVYSATKHALRGLTEALSIEFRDLGIRVADVLPGVVATPMLAAISTRLLEADPPPIARGFQDALVDTLVEKTARAARLRDRRRVVLGGGGA